MTSTLDSCLRTRRSALLAGAALLVLVSLPAAGAEGPAALPSPEELIDRHVAASGGAEAYAAVHRQVSRGSVEVVGMGISGTFEAWQAEPNLMSTTIEIQGMGTMQEATNGELVWETNPMLGPRIKEGTERAVLLRRSTLHPEVKWKELYVGAKTEGIEPVGEWECYKVTMTPAEGKPETWYFAKEDGLMRRMVTVELTPMGEIPATITLDTYGEVDGLRLPFVSTLSAMGTEMKMTVDSIETNMEIPEGTFDPPPEVLALLEAEDPQQATAQEAEPAEGGETRPAPDKPVAIVPGEPLVAGVNASKPVLIPESKAAPVYPDKARREKLEGRVILQTVILKDGTVGQVRVLQAPDPDLGLSEAAIKAVQQWRYQPAVADDRPVDVYFTIVVDFQLD